MIICQKCGQQNSDGSKFCIKCGGPMANNLPAKNYCKVCGTELKPGAKFCYKCGAGQINDDNSEVPTRIMLNQTPSSINNNQSASQKKSGKGLIIAIVVLALVLVAAGTGGGIWYCYNNELLLFANNDSDDEDDINDNKRSDRNDRDEKDDSDSEKTKAPKTKSPSPSPTQSPSPSPQDQVDKTKPIKINANITASSEKIGGTYSVNNIADSDADTAWAEGVSGTGMGEHITFKLADKQKVYGLAIMSGCMSSQSAYDENSAPTKVKVKSGKNEFSLNLSQYKPDFADVTKSFLYVDFPKEIETDEITVTIESTKMGTKSDDTYISEMYLYTFPKKGEESNYSADSWTTKHQAAPAGYILPESNTRYLTMADLAGLNADQCRLARNEIYARYGRMFDDAALQAYFNSCAWYHGTIPADQFNDNVLNEYEKANRDLIVQYEQEQGYRQ